MASPFLLPVTDLDTIIEHSEDCFRALDGSRLYLTGGTGFIGKWLLASILHANRKLQININVEIPSRDPVNMQSSWPTEAASDQLTFTLCDISDSCVANASPDFVIHAAVDSSNELNPDLLYQAMSDSAKNLSNLVADNNVQRLLFLSSGAVYDGLGLQLPAQEGLCPIGNPKDQSKNYGTGKQRAELTLTSGTDTVVARCFTFVGPYLPLRKNFAIGNFIADGIESKKTIIRGDGLGVRSYMYPSDLVIWLWRLLFHGNSNTAYNVGANSEISIADLARLVAQTTGNPQSVVVQGQESANSRNYYVPDTTRAAALGLSTSVELEMAIRKTVQWTKLSKVE